MMRLAFAALLVTSSFAAMAEPNPPNVSISGSVCLDNVGHAPIPYSFVGLMAPDFSMTAHATTETDGAFRIDNAPALREGYLMVQPPPQENANGIGAYAAQPRIFIYRGETKMDIRLPAAGSIVLMAYSPEGALLRWQDFQKLGAFAGQFTYLTDTADRTVPAVAWPAFDRVARDQGQPRELGLPALVTPPGKGYVPQVLFWDVPGYGRLLVRADNAGKGFSITAPGETLALELNVELARTAVHDIQRSRKEPPPEADAIAEQLADAQRQKDPASRAAAADKVLAGALRLRDDIVFEQAKANLSTMRRGSVRVVVRDAAGKPVSGCKVAIRQTSSDFLFGVFEGSPYDAKAFGIARDAGFNFATVLLGWDWTDTVNGRLDIQGIEKTFGLRALRDQGFVVKAHGVVWLQGYGILPQRAQSMEPDALRDAVLEHERLLLESLSDRIGIWESMNEPNSTNLPGVPRPVVHKILDASAAQIACASGSGALINGAHEGDYGGRFSLYALDGQPQNDWYRTYSAFLDEATNIGSLNEVSIIGLQYYPGFHFNESFGGLQGPATTPARFFDLLDGYARFGRAIHVSEFSVPSSYGQDWVSGYWREPWTELTQADYAERIYTIAFGHPACHSITWWDILDRKSSVITGGLCDAKGDPKPAFTRIKQLLQQWTRSEALGETGADGSVEISGFGGAYTVEASVPNAKSVTTTTRIREREIAELELTVQEKP
ncbi:MAG: hypothetical protein IT364_23845 [Candidatus Hydrogenedentes bacterium]|nr:hypothetical protein [Candidatus Hydrogenedentota bacterium]